MLLGIATLRDLMVFRPAVREQCTEILLNFCTSLKPETRLAAINSAVVFVPTHSSLSAEIEAFALSTIQALADAEDITVFEHLAKLANRNVMDIENMELDDSSIKMDSTTAPLETEYHVGENVTDSLDKNVELPQLKEELEEGEEMEVPEPPEENVSVHDIIQSKLDLFLACCAKKQLLLDR
jgi:hypothetical protein